MGLTQGFEGREGFFAEQQTVDQDGHRLAAQILEDAALLFRHALLDQGARLLGVQILHAAELDLADAHAHGRSAPRSSDG